jgi:uncharacterized Zn finger protein
VQVLESLAQGTPLTRGRAYARAGHVDSLDVAPGAVTASVQGSRAEPYRVRIELRPFPARLWERVEEELAAQAFFSARLLAGDLPAELEELFAAAGAPLFPAGVDELTQRCSCPDVAVPCKHLAATFYLLAEAFDEDPFALLHWRGRSRSDLLDRLRARRAAGQGGDTPDGRPTPGPGAGGGNRPYGAGDRGQPGRAEASTADGRALPAVGAARSLATLPAAPLAEAVDRFWVSPVPLPHRPPSLATGPDLLLRQLGAPAPALGGPGLTERLRRAYREFGRSRPEADPSTGSPAPVIASGGGTAT